LKASLEFLLEIGPEQIGPVVQSLGDRIAAGVEQKGYEVLGNRTPETGAGIVSFRKAGVDPTGLVASLRAAGIIAAPRAGWVRTSPHFYVSPEEIDRLIDALP
jgi:selenocysteine lyase/cysteine desulfurase